MSKISSNVADLIAALLITTLIFMLARPSSPAPELITAVTDLWTGLISMATGA